MIICFKLFVLKSKGTRAAEVFHSMDLTGKKKPYRSEDFVVNRGLSQTGQQNLCDVPSPTEDWFSFPDLDNNGMVSK